MLETPWRLFTLFTGRFVFEEALPSGRMAGVASVAWCAGLVAMLVWILARIRWHGAGSALVAAAGSILAVIGVSLAMGVPSFGFRYLLPIPVLLILTLVAGLKRGRVFERGAWVPQLAVLGLAAAGALALGARLAGPPETPAGGQYATTSIEVGALVEELRRDVQFHAGGDQRRAEHLDPRLVGNAKQRPGDGAYLGSHRISVPAIRAA